DLSTARGVVEAERLSQKKNGVQRHHRGEMSIAVAPRDESADDTGAADEGEIVVLLRVADPAFHLGGNPRADLLGWKVGGLAEQLLQALFAELFVLRVVRLR